MLCIRGNFMVFFWLLIALSVCIQLTSSSEILIIRHGRSRNRHSTEKNHSRWGLKALDNLTIIEHHESFTESAEANETNGGELNIVSFIESNGTFNQSNEFTGLTINYDIDYTNEPPLLPSSSPSSLAALQNISKITKKHRFNHERHRPFEYTSTTPLSLTTTTVNTKQSSVTTTTKKPKTMLGKHKSDKKKEIMDNIKSSVNKGIEYLKLHKNLDEIKIEIDEGPHEQHIDTQTIVPAGNKLRIKSFLDHTISMNKKHKSHFAKQIKMNGYEFNMMTILKSNKKNANVRPILDEETAAAGAAAAVSEVEAAEEATAVETSEPSANNNEMSILSVKTIKNHHHANNEMNINTNLADVFYVPSSTEDNPYHELMQGDQPASGNSEQINKNVNILLMENSHQHKQKKSKTNKLHSTVAVPITPLHLFNESVDSHSQKNTQDNNNNNNDNNDNDSNNNNNNNKNKNKNNNNDDNNNDNNNNNNNNMMNKDSVNKVSMNKQLEKSEIISMAQSKLVHNNITIPHALSIHPTSFYTNENDSFDNDDNHQNDEVNNNANEDLENTIAIQNDGENEENDEFANGFDDDNINFNVEDLDDTNDFDETSRNNRKNLMRGKDVVTRFLQIVESQHAMGGNCTAGTALNLGEGVVDRYAQDRFRIEAEVAVNRANMLTRIFKLTSPAVQENVNLLHASVLSMIEFDDDIFAAGHCFDWNQHPSKRGLFCPFAHRLPAPEVAMLAKDLANEYHYLGNTSEWFFLARKNAEKVIAHNEQYIKAYHSYSNDTERHAEEILSVKYEDGRWSKPYYDCGGGNIWMLTYTVPFFGFENGTYFFKGTSGIDIDLRRVDIDQCPQKNIVGTSGTPQPLNIFAGTDKCKQRTTECIPIPGLGFRRGSYKCVCRRGYYYPDVRLEFKYFNGTTLEEEYAKLMQSEPSWYSDPKSFECLPCAEGCDSCEDASPCVAELNWPMRTSILILACAVILFLPPAALFTFRYQQVKVVKAASPALLRVIALGAFFIYCTSIVMYPPPSIYTCVAKIWLREIGFSLTYGALMLKTWRISVIFRIRSAKAIKITDASLIKKLGILCCFVGVALLIRTLVAPPVVIVGRTEDHLKAFLCKTDWWDHTFTSMEVLFLAWGVRLCIVVRKAPSEFNESRFISMAIYNEFLLTCFLNVSMLFLQSPANPDLLYIIFFCHTQLTVTLLLALIFGSKVYLVFRSGGKSLEDNLHNKSSAAKFVSRSQPRTYASASSVNVSTGHLNHPNGADIRLNENEAVEEIKQLAIQLQRLYDRIPQRGPSSNVILTLLENCRSNANNQLMLKPPTQPSIETKTLSICNGSTCVDKETNTSFDNLVWHQQNGSGCHVMISDKCDNNYQLPESSSVHKSKSCNANNDPMNCSTNSINFDNLQLQCMCSSDNNSLDEYQLENCDNCSANNPQKVHIKQHQHQQQQHQQQQKHQCNFINKTNEDDTVNSFRERLLNCTNNSNFSKIDNTLVLRTNSLTKRNSELVLGTNFDNNQSALSGFNNKTNHRNNNRISKTFDSCDNIYTQKQTLDGGNCSRNKMNNTNKSEYSLATEVDAQQKEQFPYSLLERPIMKLSQSEDRNLRELKIALSSTLPDANNTNQSLQQKQHYQQQQQQQQQQLRTIGSSKLSQTITSQSQSCTSSSSSSKIDKISLSMSTSSTSDVQAKRLQHQQSINNNEIDIMTDDSPKQHPIPIAVDDKCCPNDTEQLEKTTMNVKSNQKSTATNNTTTTTTTTSTTTTTTTTNINNNTTNNNNTNGKKRKSPDGKLTIDLNHRSNEEVSV